MRKPKRRKPKQPELVCEGIDPEVLKKLNAMPCQPPSRCPRCGKKLHYWVNRKEQEKKMGWKPSGIQYIFCCPECGTFQTREV